MSVPSESEMSGLAFGHEFADGVADPVQNEFRGPNQGGLRVDVCFFYHTRILPPPFHLENFSRMISASRFVRVLDRPFRAPVGGFLRTNGRIAAFRRIIKASGGKSRKSRVRQNSGLLLGNGSHIMDHPVMLSFWSNELIEEEERQK